MMNNKANTAAMNNANTNMTLEDQILSHVKHEPENNKRLWDESHKPTPRFVIDNCDDGSVVVREVIDSANGEVTLTKEKFSQHDLKMLAVDKTVEWKYKDKNDTVKDFVKGFAASFSISFLVSYGTSLLIKSLNKKK